MVKVLLFQIYKKQGSTPEEVIQQIKLSYTSHYLDETDWQDLIEYAHLRISDIRACKPQGSPVPHKQSEKTK
jgi:hypothetical protein